MNQVELSSRYRLLNPLGAGGMGEVYRVYDRLQGEELALKRIGLLASKLSTEMRLALTREFQTLASLRHPNIIAVRDYGFDAEKRPFFTMELIQRGQPLVAAGQWRSQTEKLNLVLQALHALHYLHRRKLVHRDLKPGNLLVEGDRVKMLDFGLAALSGLQSASAGTLHYMAPELFRPLTDVRGSESSATIASDLYALGVILYELLVGWHPFASFPVLTAEIILQQAPDWDFLDLDPPLIDLLKRLLHKDPQARYNDPADVIAALSAASGQSLPLETAATRESFLQAAPFVGRRDELSVLITSLTLASEGQAQFWLIAGESGVGKSRLLNEFRIHALVQGVRVVRGQAGNRSLAFHLWHDLLRWLILSSEPSDADLAVLRAVLPGLDEFVGRTIPAAPKLDATATQQRLYLCIRQLLQSAAQQQPLLLLLEDLHNGDEASLDLLRWLVNAPLLANAPLMIVAVYRLDDENAGEEMKLAMRLAAMKPLTLHRLDEKSVADLSEAMLGRAGRRQNVIDFLHQESEGNTFFLVEVLRTLAEETGQLAQVAEMTLPKHILPGGVQQVVMRRLQRIPPEHQPLLQLAAISGRQLDLSVLTFLAQGGGGEWRVASGEWRVAGGEWRGASGEGRGAGGKELGTGGGGWGMGGEDEMGDSPLATRHSPLDFWLTLCANAAIFTLQEERWQFDHDKLRDALLQTLTPEQRRSMHQQVATAIEQVYASDLRPWFALLAEHYQQAEVTERERYYWHQAGLHAAAQSAGTTALTYLARALAMTPAEDNEARYQLLLARESVYEMQAERPLQRQDLDALDSFVQALARDEENVERRTQNVEHDIVLRSTFYVLRSSEVALRHARYAERTGDFAAAIGYAQSVLQHAQLVNNPILKTQGHLRWGTSLWQQGNYAESLTQLTQALALAQTLPQSTEVSVLIADTLLSLASVNRFLGNYAESDRCLNEALPILRSLGQRRSEAMTLHNLGVNCEQQSRYDQAHAYYEAALRIRRELNDQRGIALEYHSLGVICEGRADYSAALPFLEQSLAIYQVINDRRGLGYVLQSLASVHRSLGDYAQARNKCEQALTIRQAIGDQDGEAECWVLLAFLYLFGTGNAAISGGQSFQLPPEMAAFPALALAHHWAVQGVERARAIEALPTLGWALTVWGHVLMALSRFAEAQAAYQEAVTIRRQIGETRRAIESLAGLAQATLAQGEKRVALGYTQELLHHLHQSPIEGFDEPFLVYWAVYETLSANHDPRQQAFLHEMYERLMLQAAQIKQPALRTAYLQNIAVHGRIVKEVGQWGRWDK